MFWSKNKKNRYTLHTPILLYKVGFKGVYLLRTCFPDVLNIVDKFYNALSKLIYICIHCQELEISTRGISPERPVSLQQLHVHVVGSRD